MQRTITEPASYSGFSCFVDDTVDLEVLFEYATDFRDLSGVKSCYPYTNKVVGVIESVGEEPLTGSSFLLYLV